MFSIFLILAHSKIYGRRPILVMYRMEMPVYSTKSDKINLVSTFLTNGPPCGWLFLVGTGGDGKSMATNEAVRLWRMSLGEDPEDPISDIVYLPCNNDGTAHKTVLMKKGESPPF